MVHQDLAALYIRSWFILFRIPKWDLVLPFGQNGNTISLMKALTIKLPDAMYAEIASEAKTRKVPKSEIVRERIFGNGSTAFSAKASLWSRMEDLVVQTDELPSDLSTNKAHLKGYGKKRSH